MSQLNPLLNTIRNTGLGVLIGCSAALLPGLANAALLNFSANLDGAQSATTSSASGFATVNFDTDSGLVNVDLTVNGIGLNDLRFVGGNATPVHIHNAAAGANGPIVFDVGFFGPFEAFGDAIRSVVNDVPYTEIQGNLTSALSIGAFEQALLAGETYLNIHTNTFPAGEIRGQLQPVPLPASLWLFSSALAGFGFIARRRKKA